MVKGPAAHSAELKVPPAEVLNGGYEPRALRGPFVAFDSGRASYRKRGLGRAPWWKIWLDQIVWVNYARLLAAAAWLEAQLANVAALERFAKRGRVVPEINRPEYRQIFHSPYRIIYRVDARQVVVLTP